MKTAVSIPDPVARDIAAAARHLRISRSELLTRAAQEWLRNHAVAARAELYDKALTDTAGEEDAALRTWTRKAAARTARRLKDEE